jgi:hypothetical protein
LFFGGVGYGAVWALFLAVFAVNFAIGGVFDYGFFGVFLVCEDASFAEVDAFAACCAFLVVYGWVPLDLVSGYSFKGFLRHSCFLGCFYIYYKYINIDINKHLNIVMDYL